MEICRIQGLQSKHFGEKAEFEPNKNQKEAILYPSGPLYLPAGPGSGKTRVLLWRTLNLIVFHDIPPEDIYLSTFTEKAAHQLKEGLRTFLAYATNENGKPYDLGRMYVARFHSLCQKLILDRHFSMNRKAPSKTRSAGRNFPILLCFKKPKVGRAVGRSRVRRIRGRSS